MLERMIPSQKWSPRYMGLEGEGARGQVRVHAGKAGTGAEQRRRDIPEPKGWGLQVAVAVCTLSSSPGSPAAPSRTPSRVRHRLLPMFPEAMPVDRTEMCPF